MDSEMTIGSAQHQLVYTAPLTLKSCPALQRIYMMIPIARQERQTEELFRHYNLRTMTKVMYKALMSHMRRLKSGYIPHWRVFDAER